MKHAKAIIIQGTMSGAGKSLLAAGLCRIFAQDGFRTAPFKSQNMALNSFITREGLEMGRAQVVQAEAAGIEPDVRMNPILLKPTTDTGSQVIVNGEVLKSMDARSYFAFKKELIPLVKKTYDSLAADYDVIVIEGAGSPAEINLKQDDLVNMGMAKMAGAPVLLAGDIDRGGVFAQLYGTKMLLPPDEQAIIRGLIINKFRGDESILTPGIAMIEELCGTKVVGVVPMMDVDIDEEDSVSERLLDERGRKTDAPIEIAVIRLPHISNYTDFQVLEGMPGVNLRYVRHADALGKPDLIILPGTKNTMGDLAWLRESGMEGRILRANAAGALLIGICGGFQMLGESLSDPDGTESGGSMRGMGLLPMATVFSAVKTRTRVNGTIGQLDGAFSAFSGCKVEGYEIHMGISTPAEGGKRAGAVQSLTDLVSGAAKTDGLYRGTVLGTYVHGFFDAEGIAEKLAELLAARKGITLQSAGTGAGHKAYKERQYDILADTLRAHMDMEAVYRILKEGIRC